jgi:group I intron endonuclease
MAIVYQARNLVNGKCYVGVSINFHKRKIAHKTRAANNSPTHFHNAIRKYGWDNFEWNILYEGEDAHKKEMEYILSLDTITNGYNLTIGGEGTTGWKHTDEARRAISTANIGNTNTRGKRWKKTPTARENSSKAHEHTYEITYPDGSIRTIKGLTRFCTEHDLSVQNMWKVSKGLRKSSGGYKCRKIEIGNI